jgi:AraC-like DNA-binding protein/mannose-6-phosphate isomerase-like protein (cupin superfamily)
MAKTKRKYTKRRDFIPIDGQGQEIVDYDNPGFPCSLIATDFSLLPSAKIPWHWHDDVELTVVTEGSGAVFVNNISTTLSEGEICFVNRNVLHSMKPLAPGNCKLITIIFSPGIFSGGIGSKLYHDLVLPILLDTGMDFVHFHEGTEMKREIEDRIRVVRDAYADGTAGMELAICEAFAGFWRLLMKHKSEAIIDLEPLSARNRERIKSMIAYIEAHYSEPLALGDISAAANISPRECTRCFKSIIGETPFGYLMRHRVSIAADLLSGTDRNVTEVAAAAGFAGPSYFAKVFSRYMGVSPKQYQRKAAAQF